MARFVITTACTVPPSGPLPVRKLNRGEVVELSAAEQAAVTGAGGALRAVSAATMHDQLGEAAGVSNGD
jgi:hypothetical protein